MTVADSPRFAAGDGPGNRSMAAARFDADPACVTVEFLGAAAAGKTTAALALSADLRGRGSPVRLVQFGRASPPGDLEPPSGGSPLSIQLMKIAGGLRALLPDGRRDPIVEELLAILPPGSRVRELRIRRYAADLCRAWRDNQRAGEVMILDQGFLTLLCSMALLSDPIDRSALARGLALVPRADLLIHVVAPRSVLESRLQERVRRRRAFERLFGNEVGLWLRQAEIAAVLAELLAEEGRVVMNVQSGNRADLDAAVQSIAGEIGSLIGDKSE